MSQVNKSIISATREGYSYQDRYGLLLFLRGIKSQRLKQFYIDYPFASRNSLDVRIVNTDGEKIYEIKAGDKFKKNKTEIYKSLGTLHDYEKNWCQSVCQKNLVVSPGNEALVNNLRSNLEYLKDRKKITSAKSGLTHKQTTKKMAEDFVKGFNKSAPNKISTKNLLDFLKTFDIPIIGQSSNRYNDNISELDGSIASELQFFLNKAGATNGEAFVGVRIIMLELLDVIQCGAGSKNDLLPELQKKLCECLGRRMALDTHKPGGINMDAEIEKCINIVTPKIMQALNTIIEESTLSATSINEPEIMQ